LTEAVLATEGNRRAVILGGGGVTGIAWETGLLKGLQDAGIDLLASDAVIGTSAGSFAGAYLASGRVDEFFARQFVAEVVEIQATMTEETIAAFRAAIAEGAGEPRAVAQALGRIAQSATTVTASARAEVIQARLSDLDWPDVALQITALDCLTGDLRIFDSEGGVPLSVVAAASGALPGLWPVVEADGRLWIDGGSVSPVNAHLGSEYDRVLVLAPAPNGFPGLPTVYQDVDDLRAAGVRVVLLTPDDESRQAIGDNVFDPARRGPAADAGLRQGRRAKLAVAAIWS
jgi:NTE family protein